MKAARVVVAVTAAGGFMLAHGILRVAEGLTRVLTKMEG